MGSPAAGRLTATETAAAATIIPTATDVIDFALFLGLAALFLEFLA